MSKTKRIDKSVILVSQITGVQASSPSVTSVAAGSGSFVGTTGDAVTGASLGRAVTVGKSGSDMLSENTGLPLSSAASGAGEPASKDGSTIGDGVSETAAGTGVTLAATDAAGVSVCVAKGASVGATGRTAVLQPQRAMHSAIAPARNIAFPVIPAPQNPVSLSGGDAVTMSFVTKRTISISAFS